MGFVLLLRPNDFIADSMALLLTKLGLHPLRAASLSDLEQLPLDEVVGAVISTAATSVVQLTFVEAVAKLRSRARTLPLIVSTMVREIPRAALAVGKELEFVDPSLEVVPPTLAGLQSPLLGTPRGVLMLRKDDVESATETTLELVTRHFRVRRSP